MADDGQGDHARAPAGHRRDVDRQHRHAAERAQRCSTAPTSRRTRDTLQLAFSDAEERKLSQAELASKIREIVTREFPGVEVLQYPGGLVASVFANGYTAPFVVEVHDDNLAELERGGASGRRRRADRARRARRAGVACRTTIRRSTSTPTARRPAWSGRTSARPRETTLEATLGNINTPGVWIDANNGQSYYVVTYYDGAHVADTQELGGAPGSRQPRRASRCSCGAYGDVHRALGPVAVERNHLARVAHVLMQTEGRDIGSAAAISKRACIRDPRTQHIDWRFVGQVELMRTTFGGLGLALGLAVMVVFMIMASQFKSLRLPFVMLFTIPVSLVGIVLALMAAGQGFSITALMGILMVIGIAVSNGILLVDDANRRFTTRGPTRSRRSSRRRARASCRSR